MFINSSFSLTKGDINEYNDFHINEYNDFWKGLKMRPKYVSCFVAILVFSLLNEIYTINLIGQKRSYQNNKLQ